MSDTEKILQFCTNLVKEMVVSGANLERVEIAATLICRAYGMRDVSLFLLSTHMSISAVGSDGGYVIRQVTIPPASIHLEKLKQLNRLSYMVVSEKPSPDDLPGLLRKACRGKGYPAWGITAARVLAMVSLCLIFGGKAPEAVIIVFVTILAEFITKGMGRLDINRLISSGITMCITTTVIMVLYTAGLCQNPKALIITVTMIFLPGIPLANAVRNLLCDHEMNGILQLMRIVIETTALGAGIVIGIYFFRGEGGLGGLDMEAVSEPLLLLLMSFLASVGFAVVFEIPPHDLWLAGAGGVLTRIFLICLPGIVPYRIIYTGVAALMAALYAEFLAGRRKDPSTYFVYPAIIPLIPGDLFYYAIGEMIYSNWDKAAGYGYQCILALAGMSIGFVVSSSVSHYMRKMRHGIRRGRNAVPGHSEQSGGGQ